MSQRRTSRRTGGKQKSTDLPTYATHYNGPAKLPQGFQENRTELLELKSLLPVTSSIAGVISTSVDNNPSGYLDWSSIAALWDDYRAVSLMVEFFPYDRYSKVTVSSKPIYVVFDRDSTGALGSVNACIQYESCKQESLEDPWTRVVKMTDPGDSAFITTASPAATFTLKTYQSGLTASTTYGEFMITLIVQVRGRN
jgi:hypothetical protein